MTPLLLFLAGIARAAAPDTVLVHLDARVTSVAVQADGSKIATLDRGAADGLVGGGRGKVLRPSQEQGVAELGPAALVSTTDDTATARITGDVQVGDVLELPVRVPKGDHGVAFQLAAMGIVLTDDATGEPLWTWREFLAAPDVNLDGRVAERGVAGAVMDAQYVLEAKTPTHGRYANVSMYDQMSRTSPADVHAFLLFVRSFPGKYLGNTFRFGEVYATWLLNDAPTSADELAEQARSMPSVNRVAFLKAHTADLFAANMADQWLTDCTDLINVGRLDDAQARADLLDAAATATGDAKVRVRAAEAKGHVASAKADWPAAVTAWSDLAKLAPGDDDRRVAENNEADALYRSGRYDEALTHFQAGLKLSGDGPSSLWPLGGLGNVHLAREEYAEAADWYEKALAAAATRDDLSGLEWESTFYSDIGRVRSKQGRYREAIDAWQKGLAIAKELGWTTTVASALEDTSDGWWNLGDYAKAKDAQDQALAMWRDLGDEARVASGVADEGSLEWDLGHLDAALADYQQALDLDRQRGDDASALYVLRQTASLQTTRGDFEAALKLLVDARAVADRLGDAGTSADVARDVARAQAAASRWDDAVAAYEDALGLARQAGSRAQEESILEDYGGTLFSAKRSGDAIARTEDALALAKALGDEAAQGRLLRALSWDHGSLLGDHAKALELGQQSLAIAKASGSKLDEARTLLSIGDAQVGLARLADAQASYEAALAVAKDTGDVGLAVSAKLGLGGLRMTLGDYDGALELFEQARDVASAGGLTSQAAFAGLQVAWVEKEQGRYEDALAATEDARKTFEALHDDWDVANALNTRASISSAQGRYAEAEADYTKSIEVHRAWNDPRGLMAGLSNRGELYEEQGDHDRAIADLTEALEIGRRVDSFEALTLTAGALARVHAEKGDLDDALALVDGAIAEARKTGSREGLPWLETLAGRVHRQRGELADARTSLAQALADADEQGLPSQSVRARLELGVLAREQGDLAGSEKWLRDAVTRAVALKTPGASWEPRYELARTLSAAGRDDDAVKTWFDAVGDLETLKQHLAGGSDSADKFAADREDVYEGLVDLLTKLGRQEDAFRVLAMMKSFELRTLSGGVVAATGEEQAAIDEGESIRERQREVEKLVAAERQKPAAKQRQDLLDQWQAELDQLEMKFQAYAEGLKKAHPDVYQKLEIAPPDFYKLRGSLAPDEAFVEPLVLDDRIVVFVVRGGDAPLVYREVKADETHVDELVRTMRDALQNPGAAWTPEERSKVAGRAPSASAAIDPAGPAKALHELLIAPILPDLDGVTTLIVCPSGRLRYVPFAALYDGQRYLVETYRVAVLTEAGALGEHHAVARKEPLLALGDPDGSLPGAEQEVETLGKVWGRTTTTWVGEDATKARLRREVGQYRMLHLATHGVLLDDDPKGSYLLLAGDGEDARLTFSEIVVLPLDRVDLAVLSACETAVGDHGDGAEISGLAYQFEQRGADAVIASLWSVNDRSTSSLMTSLYAGLGKRGETRAEALREAQLALLADPATRHPYYWAPFVLIGDWR